MEIIMPPVSADEARAALTEVESAQRAVRDIPWPTWLYPVNALLLGAYCLATLIGGWRLAAWLGISAVTLALNGIVGKRMGTPWTVPTSRGFQTCVWVAAACLVAALIVGRDHPVGVTALAAATATVYLLAGLLHRRSTSR